MADDEAIWLLHSNNLKRFQLAYAFLIVCIFLLDNFTPMSVEATTDRETTGYRDDKHQLASKWAISRKSIVFDLKTPKVFYCPQSKQSDDSKMIVKSVPLEKLCEFGGKPKPRGSRSDCYNDVDESEFACGEKKRFMLRLEAIDNSAVITDLSDINFNDDELEFVAPHKYNKKAKALRGYSKKKSEQT